MSLYRENDRRIDLCWDCHDDGSFVAENVRMVQYLSSRPYFSHSIGYTRSSHGNVHHVTFVSRCNKKPYLPQEQHALKA